jgi:hypothetical protein
MADRPGVIERAFELARTGDYPTNQSIVAQLRKENYSGTEGHFSGQALRAQLRRLHDEATRNRQRVTTANPA